MYFENFDSIFFGRICHLIKINNQNLSQSNTYPEARIGKGALLFGRLSRGCPSIVVLFPLLGDSKVERYLNASTRVNKKYNGNTFGSTICRSGDFKKNTEKKIKLVASSTMGPRAAHSRFGVGPVTGRGGDAVPRAAEAVGGPQDLVGPVQLRVGQGGLRASQGAVVLKIKPRIFHSGILR